jgi:hypothetical protein
MVQKAENLVKNLIKFSQQKNLTRKKILNFNKTL